MEQELPSSVQTERTVIGAMLLDENALNDALEYLTAEDFLLDSHQKVFTCIVEMAETGNAVDTITVMEDLTRRRWLDSVGGAAYLTHLMAGIPRNPNIASYCRIVKDKSLLRQLASLCNDGMVRAMDSAENSADVMGELEEKILALSQQQTTKGFTTILDAIVSTGSLDEYVDKMCDPKELTGLATGFMDVDKVWGGMQPKSLIIVAARPSMGKALKCGEPVLTIKGWKRNDELKVGDQIASLDGGYSVVDGVFPQGERMMFAVEFSDGRIIEADEEHLWSVMYRQWSEPRVVSTGKLREMLTRKRYRNRVWIDTFSGEYGSESPLPLHPYAMGALIGNGSFVDGTPHFSSRDAETVERLNNVLPAGMEMKRQNEYDWRIINPKKSGNQVNAAMREVNLYGLYSHEKFIPQIYLQAPKRQRLELMRGLIDTDGNIEKTGSIVYSTSSLRLAENVQYLARSLGGASYDLKQARTALYASWRIPRGAASVSRVHHAQRCFNAGSSFSQEGENSREDEEMSFDGKEHYANDITSVPMYCR